MKQKELSVWLRIVVILIGVAVLFLAMVIVPVIGRELAAEYPEYEYMFWPCVCAIWATTLPVFAALVLAWCIFSQIGRDNSFCIQNAVRLKAISILAAADTAMYVLGALVLCCMNMLHPSILLLAICIVFIGIAMTVAAAALSHLTRKAAELKQENDLTI